ncbi:hypothetical protein ACQKMV_18030 [Lysinibacillus sp. NPDC094403]|uniref:hypothetical protein n=1 Tax=Lysinibacillus sp. NPDC094403 TaxID=3390581 RepID=UPI003D065FB0
MNKLLIIGSAPKVVGDIFLNIYPVYLLNRVEEKRLGYKYIFKANLKFSHQNAREINFRKIDFLKLLTKLKDQWGYK